MLSLIPSFLIAFAAALIPIVVWLTFLEHEDKTPEPRKLVVFAFLAGMIAVIAVIPVEKLVADLVPDSTVMILLWAAIEEIAKLIAVTVVVLRRTENHEPIDSLMYIIATALGFSALENTLFLLNPIIHGQFFDAFILGNFRFIGATLLHTVASSIIGLSLAFSFYKTKAQKELYLFIGVILAIALHTFFNLSIIYFDGSKAMIAFYTVWIGLVIILLLIEKVKQIKRQ